MNSWLKANKEIERQLECPASKNCPLAPCYSCLRNKNCESFSIYRKEHPEYDEKYTHYVVNHRSQIRAVETQLKQLNLCGVVGREQVPQHECYRPNNPSSGQGKKISYQRETKTMKLDFSEVTELESKLIEAGEHELTIKAAKEKKSANGTMMLVLDMVDEDEGFTRDNVCLEGPGAFKAKQLCDALGLDSEQFAAMDASDLVGMTVMADVVVEEYEGKDYSKIKKYLK